MTYAHECLIAVAKLRLWNRAKSLTRWRFSVRFHLLSRRHEKVNVSVVRISVPARIHHISSGGHLQVKKGGAVRIECSASGNPSPNVTWTRKNNILPNGEFSSETRSGKSRSISAGDEKLPSPILSIDNMDRHKGGVYICTATNGVGKAASSQVVLHVLCKFQLNVD